MFSLVDAAFPGFSCSDISVMSKAFECIIFTLIISLTCIFMRGVHEVILFIAKRKLRCLTFCRKFFFVSKNHRNNSNDLDIGTTKIYEIF